MRITYICTVVATLALTGCYTQLASGGYVQRSQETAYGYAVAPADSAEPDSLAVQAAGRDTLYRPATVIVNNYWRESPYYRGYAIDDWDYPGFTLGFYSSGYRAYQGAWWWDRRHHGYHRDYRYRSSYGYGRGGGYSGGSGGGTVITGPSGNYPSDKRIFTPEPDRTQPRKGRRSETTPEPEPAPKAGSTEPAPAAPAASTPATSTPATSPANSDDRDSSPSVSKPGRPRPQKGKRR